MKITKLFLSIALVALTVTTYGRINEFSSSEFEKDLIMESWMASPFMAMERDLEMENWMITPFESMDNELELENWMSSSFTTDALTIECWMSTPFEVEKEQYSTVIMVASK